MRASEIMTSPVKTVTLTTPAREIAELLAKVNISGVPVVDGKGGLLGIVSEADLMSHAVAAEGTRAKWWLGGDADPDAMARAFTKIHGRVASDVMTRHVAAVAHDATLSEVAQAMEVHGVKRIPVVKDGALVGIITRRDLVKAFAKTNVPATAALGNAGLQRALLERMAEEKWLDASYVNVLIREDTIELTGYVPSADQKRAVAALVSELDDKRRLVDKLEIGLPMVSDFM